MAAAVQNKNFIRVNNEIHGGNESIHGMDRKILKHMIHFNYCNPASIVKVYFNIKFIA
jgi:hypothetical protein